MKKNIVLIAIITFDITLISFFAFLFFLPGIIPKHFHNHTSEIYYENPSNFTKSLYELGKNNIFFNRYIDQTNEDNRIDITTETKEEKEIINFEIKSEVLDNLSDEQSIRINGEDGLNIYSSTYYFYNGPKESLERKYSSELVNSIEQKPEIVIAGNKDNNLVLEELNQISSFLNEDQALTVQLFTQEVMQVDSNSDQIEVGEFRIELNNCPKYSLIKIYFDVENNEYIYDEEKLLLLSDLICDNQFYPEPVEVALCTDCYLESITKQRRLLESYNPQVEYYNTEGREYFIEPRVQPFVEGILLDAIEAGHNINVTSGYRSYEIQVETFEYWVRYNQEIRGIDRATAEIEANTISARPGFSEHQLGTTVDLNSIDCEAFTDVCPANEELWVWLAENAHEYGFILSYPEGKEDMTGYRFEPWHYRWIGVENAKMFLEQDLTLNQWLVDQGDKL